MAAVRGPQHWPPIVTRRQQILAALRRWPAPPALGPVPEGSTDPVTAMLFGVTSERVREWLASSSGSRSGALSGVPGSAGVAEGPARVYPRSRPARRTRGGGGPGGAFDVHELDPSLRQVRGRRIGYRRARRVRGRRGVDGGPAGPRPARKPMTRDGKAESMPTCNHLDQGSDHPAPRVGRRLRGVPSDRGPVVPSPDLPRLRKGRVLRRLTQPSRQRSRSDQRSPADPLTPAG